MLKYLKILLHPFWSCAGSSGTASEPLSECCFFFRPKPKCEALTNAWHSNEIREEQEENKGRLSLSVYLP